MANGVTYAGQPAVLDYNKTVAKFVAQRWPASRWPFAQGRNDIPLAANSFGQGEIAGRFRLPYPDVPAPRINELIVPTGASRYGRGLFLFGRDEMAAIAASVWGYSGNLESLPQNWGTSSSEATLRIECGETVTLQMFALPPTLIDGSGSNGLWLLPLVDSRYVWLQMPAKSVLEQDDTWSDLFESLGSAIGITLSPGSINSAHGRPDRESFADSGVSAAVAIDAAALSIGARIVRPDSSGLFFSTPGNATDTLDSFNLPMVKPWAGGQVPTRALPRRVTLIGRKAVDHFGHCGDSVQVARNIGSGSLNTAEVVVHSPQWVEHYRIRAGTVGYVVDSYSFDDFYDLAGRMASDVSAWGALQYSLSAPGVVDWTLTGHDDYMSIRVEGSDNADAVSTHIQSLPPDFAPKTHLGQRPNVYIHANDSGIFTLTEDVQEDGWAAASILPMDGSYAGSDVRQVLIRPLLQKTGNRCSGTCQVMFTYTGGPDGGIWEVTRPCADENCTCPPLPTDIPQQSDTVRELPCQSSCTATVGEGTQFLASYQCEQGWHAVPTPAAECELPAWEIEATLPEVLYATDETGEADYTKIRSVFPHSGDPPGVDEDGKVPFKNPWRLDALCESKVILQRVPNQPEAHKCEVTYHTGEPGWWSYTGEPCPDGFTCPPLPTDEPEETTVRELDCVADNNITWELRKVERYKARWIKIRYETGGSGDYDLLEYWEGDDPKDCGEYLSVLFPMGQPCTDCDVVACYDPFTNSYRAVSSPSAMLGEAEDMNIVQALAFDGCGINFVRQSAKVFPCGSEPSFTSTEPNLVAVNVLSGASLIAPVEGCEGTCKFEWTNGDWMEMESCSSQSNCQCTGAPTAAPGAWNNYQTVMEFPCGREDGQSPRPGSLDFSIVSVLVCGSTAGSGVISIPLTECEENGGGDSPY